MHTEKQSRVISSHSYHAYPGCPSSVVTSAHPLDDKVVLAHYADCRGLPQVLRVDVVTPSFRSPALSLKGMLSARCSFFVLSTFPAGLHVARMAAAQYLSPTLYVGIPPYSGYSGLKLYNFACSSTKQGPALSKTTHY